jgi:hypothetical protein
MLSINGDKDLRRSLNTGNGRTPEQPVESNNLRSPLDVQEEKPGTSSPLAFSPLAVSRRLYPQNSLNRIELYLDANAKASPERENNNGKGTIETGVRVRLR